MIRINLNKSIVGGTSETIAKWGNNRRSGDFESQGERRPPSKRSGPAAAHSVYLQTVQTHADCRLQLPRLEVKSQTL